MLSPRRLQVPAAFTAPALDALTGLRVVPGRTEDRRSALYDTVDLDLTRWGVSIEHDTQQGWRIELTAGRRLRRLVRLDVHAVITLLVARFREQVIRPAPEPRGTDWMPSRPGCARPVPCR